METALPEIQVESKDHSQIHSSNELKTEANPQNEKPVEKSSFLCFKRKKKVVKASKFSKDDSEPDSAAQKFQSQGSNMDHTKADVSDQSPIPQGAWAAIKHLVPHRKRSSSSSKKQRCSEATEQLGKKSDDTHVTKKKTRSKYKFPCIKFSRGKKKRGVSEMTEESDCVVKVKEVADSSDRKTQTHQDDLTVKGELTTEFSGSASREDGDFISPNVSDIIISAQQDVISEEHQIDADQKNQVVQAETTTIENDSGDLEKSHAVQLQQESVTETLKESDQLPYTTDPTSSVVSEKFPLNSPEVPTKIMEETKTVLEKGPSWEDGDRDLSLSEKSETKASSSESDFTETAVSVKPLKLEEYKKMEPIAIIITDTEICEYDVTKSRNVPKQLLISEQYETLLIETASSLVKKAIQLSVEQLVNEMASDNNKISNFLQ
ncbi:A-kinase anchor protein 5 [Ornithorhynchus anatinus]|uniref:A-kinase anchoring protein 5 n=1 Tax=Ornithorhynchus anatinus TaxID=9258 RepID=F7B741_ORNAN|nr:A-kinase anchor protein 5 [Ornithorhynchus anatinus]